MSMLKARLNSVLAALIMMLSLLTACLVGTGTAQAAETDAYVFSPAMGRDVHVTILSGGGGGPKATLILLDGLRATESENGWLFNTDVRAFFADKNVNVVIPWGGGGSYYSDWERDDPTLGRVKWETFLTRELPVYMAGSHGSDPRRYAVAGLSMSGGSALMLAAHRPDMFQAAASFSGYPTYNSPGFAPAMMLTVTQMGGNPLNMWGIWPNLKWLANDPMLQVGGLRGKGVYLSSGYGGPGWLDPNVNPFLPGFDAVKFVQQVPLETAAGLSTTQFLPVVALAGARVTSNITAIGVHGWQYWQDSLKDAWFRTLAPSLGV